MKLFTKDHEWVETKTDGTILLGVTKYAVDQLGNVVYVELPEEGDSFDKDEECVELESIKSTGSIATPVSGEIYAINEKLEDNPELVNDEPFGDGWLIKIVASDFLDVDELMNEEQYNEYVKEL